MSQHETAGQKRDFEGALHLGHRKKACVTDPLVHHGRHYGRTVHAMCNVKALLTNGLVMNGERSDEPQESFTDEEREENAVYLVLLQMVPGLQERLMEASDEDFVHVGQMIQKGVSGARSDDTKSLKGVVIDWIVPNGQPLNPPLSRNSKVDRGFNHPTTGALLCPTGLDWSDPDIQQGLKSGAIAVPGDQWPMFIYRDSYDVDDPWKGAFRSLLLVKAYKHIFTSPSSVERECKATRSGNARIHGMVSVTTASIAYIATQLRFALSSSSVFSRTDLTTDSERFYHSVLGALNDPEERAEVSDLLLWWNRFIFPNYSSAKRTLPKDSALARIKAKRALIRSALENGASGS